MAPDPQKAKIVAFPDLSPATRSDLMRGELGTQFDQQSRVFGLYAGGDVFDYGEWTAREVSVMLTRDGQAAALESVLTLPIRQASRAIEPSKGDSGEAELCNSVLFAPGTSGGMKTPLQDVIGQVTSSQIYKKSFHELCWAIREKDGAITLDAIAFRPTATCELKRNAKTGRMDGFRQQTWQLGGFINSPITTKQGTLPGYVDIPRVKSFVHINGRHREPLTGTSELDLTYWALAHGSEVQTPDGPVLIEDIRRGDLVFGGNGEPTRVTAVHPRGKRQMYRVAFSDKTSVLCDAEHLWEVRDRDTANRFITRVMSTAEIMAAGLKRYDGYRFHVPLCGEAQYPERELPLDPYLLGAWIGDGTMLYRPIGRWSKRAGEMITYGPQSPRLTTGDPFIAEEAARRSPPGVEVRRYGKIQYGFADTLHHHGNRLRDALVMLGLGRKSEERFIPEIYRQASPKQRWDLLRGLMDTDGHAYRNGGGKSQYTTSSQQLAADVQDLVQSLGGRAVVSCPPTPGHGGTLNGHEVHRRRLLYRIQIVTRENPFLLPRKADTWEGGGNNERKSSTKAIVSIASAGERECRCITVEAPDGLFLTGNWTVTHNCYRTKLKLLFLLAALVSVS